MDQCPIHRGKYRMLYHTGQLANKQIDEELISCKKRFQKQNTGPAVKKVSYQSFSVESNQVCGSNI